MRICLWHLATVDLFFIVCWMIQDGTSNDWWMRERRQTAAEKANPTRQQCSVDRQGKRSSVLPALWITCSSLPCRSYVSKKDLRQLGISLQFFTYSEFDVFRKCIEEKAVHKVWPSSAAATMLCCFARWVCARHPKRTFTAWRRTPQSGWAKRGLRRLTHCLIMVLSLQNVGTNSATYETGCKETDKHCCSPSCSVKGIVSEYKQIKSNKLILNGSSLDLLFT